MNDALLPCPFCGDEGVIDHDPGYNWYQAGCSQCGVTLMEVGSREKAVEDWNTRALLPTPVDSLLDAG